ncbi:MAG: hypothetical protein H7249_15480 [Chitinophagaceae bacterium]|nr:hypothetical protein [Oligoflexus sp.]
MSAQPVKKKRYEGVIQFQDPLRQALVCLQAALAERFVTGAQDDYLKLIDTPEASHFLMTSDGSPVGDLSLGLQSRHLLLRIEQLENSLPKWQAPDFYRKIAAWIDSSDPLTTQFLFQVLAQAASPHSTSFDLSSLLAWGTAVDSSLNPKNSSFQKPWLDTEHTRLLQAFKGDAEGLFKKVEKQSLAADGCSVSFLLEGPTSLSWQALADGALKKLAKMDHHLVALNYTSGPKPRLQCAYLMPMRLPLKDLQTSSLKGFLLLCDIKEAAKKPKSVLVI